MEGEQFNFDCFDDHLDEKETKDALDALSTFPFEVPCFKIRGRICRPKRSMIAFGDAGLKYKFSGCEMVAHSWPECLIPINKKVEKKCNASFNFVLVNYYKDGSEFISAHKDDEKDLDPSAPIACLSLGASRTIIFRRKGFEPKKFPIRGGSLYVMRSPTNLYWSHEIPVEPAVKSVRISLTFRKIADATPPSVLSESIDENNHACASSFGLALPTIESQTPFQESVNLPENNNKRSISDSDFDFEYDNSFLKRLREIHELSLNCDIVKKNLTGDLFLCCVKFKESLKVHLRIHYTDENGFSKPTKIGLTMDLQTWYEIYIKLSNFSLCYSDTSFVANNCIAVLSFNKFMVFKSLCREGQSITFNESQFNAFNDNIADFTEMVNRYILDVFLMNYIEKYMNVQESSTYADEELMSFLITSIEKNMSEICLKRFKCNACMSGSLSQHKHLCQTLSPREMYQTFPQQMLLLLDCKNIINDFKLKTCHVSKSFLTKLNFDHF